MVNVATIRDGVASLAEGPLVLPLQGWDLAICMEIRVQAGETGQGPEAKREIARDWRGRRATVSVPFWR